MSSIEQLEMRDHLSHSVPLVGLPTPWLDEIMQVVKTEYIPRDTYIHRIGEYNNVIRLIRSGGIEATKADGSLYGRFAEGDWIGYRSLMTADQIATIDVRTIEDTVFYVLPGELFTRLINDNEKVRKYFSEHKPERLRAAIRDLSQQDYNLLNLQMAELMRPALSVPMSHTIRETATQMTQAKQGIALILDDQQKLCGVVTDQDFRSKVIATGQAVDAAITQIMTPKPLILSPEEKASEALLLMARRNIRHIPITDKVGNPLGVVSASDLLRQQSHNAVFLVGDIHAANDIDTLQRLSSHLPQALVRMVRNGLPAYDIGHAISSIGQAIVRRLIILAEEQWGPPPVPYAFIVAGSMGRREQTAHSDQDNGMIISDEFVPELHDEYFAKVAKFVSDGMDACGYVYCPGNIMATNPQWRQPLKVWREQFRSWIETPDPQALLNASIFFDFRWVAGDESLVTELRNDVLARTQTAGLFKALLAGNALTFHPPLGFFKGFILEKQGTGEKVMDMKKRGVVPIIDLVRVYALAKGIVQTNTFERIDAIEAIGAIHKESSSNIKDALEFISIVRLKHQAQQIQQGIKPDNYLSPDSLSALERRHLKDAFEVVAGAQDAMKRNFQAGG
ncbi:DUF294 nucleotidyltransferase-like domain-containing protein [Thiofilum flexile]|uniref:DUF294 nucleotidyltransferase-like domain-containing protein n=1 Tax=Thiofilum flexile TaxID=125627 RepID=UPI000367D16F|nr:DUF294 nucleotidyltransferase-like domain-containing protein [Thiofilum flexile]